MRKSTAKKFQLAISLMSLLAIFVWACRGAEVNISTFIKGFPNAIQVIKAMLPPNFSIIPRLTPAILETVQIAIVSIILTSIIVIPISFLAAKNTSPSYIVYRVVRIILNLLRSIPPLLYALIFIAMVGLGPFPGVVGLVLHCIGALGKYFSEAIENVNPSIVESTKSTGATFTQVILFAIIPELKPLFLGYILYYFEYCIRTSTILGLVGAGGIGFELLIKIRLFQYKETLAILITMVAIVTVVDIISFTIRKRMIGLQR